MRKESGFTLVEVLVVIGIIAALAAMAVPTYINMIPRLKLNGATRQVFGDLSQAKMQTISTGKKVGIFFTSSGHRYKICNDADGNGTVTCPNSDDTTGEGTVKLIDIQTKYNDVTFDLAHTSDVVFNPIGTATNATITLQNSSTSQKTITVGISGRIKIN